MNEMITLFELTVEYIDRQPIAAVSAVRADAPGPSQHRNDPQAVPYAIRPELTLADGDSIRGRQCRQWVRHPDIRGAGGQDENVTVVETTERVLYLYRAEAENLGELCRYRGAALIDEEPIQR